MKVKYPAYQCFKTTARVVYCSAKKYSSHPDAAPWVAACLKAHHLKGNDILGKPYPSENQPTGATIFKMP